MGSRSGVEGRADTQAGGMGRVEGCLRVDGGVHHKQGSSGRKQQVAERQVAFGGPCVHLDGSFASWPAVYGHHHIWVAGSGPSDWN